MRLQQMVESRLGEIGVLTCQSELLYCPKAGSLTADLSGKNVRIRYSSTTYINHTINFQNILNPNPKFEGQQYHVEIIVNPGRPTQWTE